MSEKGSWSGAVGLDSLGFRLLDRNRRVHYSTKYPNKMCGVLCVYIYFIQ